MVSFASMAKGLAGYLDYFMMDLKGAIGMCEIKKDNDTHEELLRIEWCEMLSKTWFERCERLGSETGLVLLASLTCMDNTGQKSDNPSYYEAFGADGFASKRNQLENVGAW